jgi:hypothetical protein
LIKKSSQKNQALVNKAVEKSGCKLKIRTRSLVTQWIIALNFKKSI